VAATSSLVEDLQGADDHDALSDDARHLISDKDVLLTAVQTSHELHASKIDALEDTLVTNEINRASELVAKHTQWAYTRNRDRIIEVVTYHERNVQELDALLGNEEDEDDDEEL
jgi:RNAse (barnase) inhibitor barstar